MKKVQFDQPYSCSRCVAIRNNEFGDFYCFLTEEKLSINYLDCPTGNNCPAIDVKDEEE